MISTEQEIFIQRSDSGNYALTDSGELQAYLYTLQNLLNFYMNKKLKMDPSQVRNKLAELKIFANTHLKAIDDYLNKLSLIAQFIGEPDTNAFSRYIGKQFLPSLEQIKHKLIEREIPIYRKKFENPFRTPSYDLLERFEKDFVNASVLVWPPKKKQEDLKKDISNDKTSGTQQAVAPQTSEEPVVGKMEEAEQQEPTISEMPGKILLDQLEKEFTEARPMSLSVKKILTREEKEDLTDVPKQFSFLKFTQTFNQFSRLIQTKDTKDYDKWFSKLEAKQKAMIKINQLFSKEIEGEEIDWNRQIKSIANQHYLKERQTKKIRQEAYLYRKILSRLHFILQGMPDSVKQLYSQFISLLNDEQAKSDAKKTSLKMVLLQVNDSSIKENLGKEISHMIDKLEVL